MNYFRVGDKNCPSNCSDPHNTQFRSDVTSDGRVCTCRWFKPPLAQTFRQPQIVLNVFQIEFYRLYRFCKILFSLILKWPKLLFYKFLLEKLCHLWLKKRSVNLFTPIILGQVFPRRGAEPGLGFRGLCNKAGCPFHNGIGTRPVDKQTDATESITFPQLSDPDDNLPYNFHFWCSDPDNNIHYDNKDSCEKWSKAHLHEAKTEWKR